ncbi:PPOX class F420-dependent oxidoreductase [Planosporangium flavigriseum]|uniref:PPOX class F420-dependent oxidoreductase n=1 Tax=Planosporangium flavigriseum TaxID=373681 RepID=A0A8J3LIW1_9ACTN|nr:PPOX class F420-dependent oxidoreductase [Planosporangium flavigriseum]NJC64696.1 PPOX class F420-dependent oxidoreductase [Planosporangium flavigriseum]GIG74078.1 PPOX class F420-dependent oxidoreductase [Planosporangium flavigriseum]
MPFSEAERRYLSTQRLGRLATVGPDGVPQNNPVGFRYNPETDTIDIGGYNMGASRKFRNVAANGRVAFVVDDVASVDPWRVRGIEIRGHAEAVRGAPATPPASNDIIRIHPRRVLSWGIDPDQPGMLRRDVEVSAQPR